MTFVRKSRIKKKVPRDIDATVLGKSSTGLLWGLLFTHLESCDLGSLRLGLICNYHWCRIWLSLTAVCTRGRWLETIIILCFSTTWQPHQTSSFKVRVHAIPGQLTSTWEFRSLLPIIAERESTCFWTGNGQNEERGRIACNV